MAKRTYKECDHYIGVRKDLCGVRIVVTYSSIGGGPIETMPQDVYEAVLSPRGRNNLTKSIKRATSPTRTLVDE